MGFFNYLFSFDGRINRAKMWAFILVGIVFELIFAIALQMTLGFGALFDVMQSKTTWSAAVAATPSFFPVMAGLYVIFMYVYLSIVTKRLHDRDKSVWWLLVFILLPAVCQIPFLLHLPEFLANLSEAMKAAAEHRPPPEPPQDPIATIGNGIASIIGLWAFVELYILKGTEGTNRFGPDPLAGR
ncbi:MAG TPA: DUF805 domain-containing protein [Rhizomicrobium sp.]|nr:DUF805 domain-containing protein [Rhizomicrobium sp.]